MLAPADRPCSFAGGWGFLVVLAGWLGDLGCFAVFLLLARLIVGFGCLFVLYKLGGLPRLLTPGGR
ncbi:MAG: hypothetical protein K6T61_14275, partial [Bryobacteraceae bacterium]|nr:hypothetical protein [Bryobacteraceae bacterium]